MAVACLSLLSQPAIAEDTKLLQCVNSTDQDVSCLILYVRDTNGSLVANRDFVVGGPFKPRVGVSTLGAYSVVKIDWDECVIAPRNNVSVLLQTRNGPMSLRSANWCKDGVQLGRLDIPSGTTGRGPDGSFQPLPPTISGPGAAYKVTNTYRKGRTAPAFCTPWFIGPPRFDHRSFCWYRIKCDPGYDWYYRTVFYCCPTSPQCVFGAFRICIPLSSWKYGGTVPGEYELEATSVKPRGEIINWNIFGPPKNLSRKLSLAGMTYSHEVFTMNPESGLFKRTHDAIETFQAMGNALVPTFQRDAEIPRPESFEEMLAVHGRPYLKAAESARQLANTLKDAAFGSKVGSDYRRTHRSLTLVAEKMNIVGTCFSAGRAPSSSDVGKLARAFNQLALEANRLGDKYGFKRFESAASSYRELSEQYALATRQLDAGLQTVAHKDDFLWGMIMGPRTTLKDLGVSFDAHARVVFGTPESEGDSNSIPAAIVKIEDRQGNLIDRFDVHVSDFNTVHLPFLGNVDPDQDYVATIKIPGFLARSFRLSDENDGNSIRINELVAGDVDDDNCVSFVDLRLTVRDEGEGGQDAEFVPSTDANSDGIVNQIDSDLVYSNLGKCGDE